MNLNARSQHVLTDWEGLLLGDGGTYIFFFNYD